MKSIILLLAISVLPQIGFAQISSSYQWTWINGDNQVDQPGNYGHKGVESPTNKPGSRGYGSNWIDAKGNFWLFGGYGFDKNRKQGDLNDLWKYNPSTNQWTWVAGSDTVNALALRGELGQEGPNFTPSAKGAASAWVDATGTELYLFGGSNRNWMAHSDVWVFNTLTNQWRWVKGTMINGQAQCTGQALGEPGRFNAGVWPACRAGVSVASAGNIAYLFGGVVGINRNNELYQYADSNFPVSEQKDQWAYLSSILYSVNLAGRYNGPATKPGSRYNAMSFLYYNGVTYDYYVFGGTGYGSSKYGQLNDTWKYSGLDPLSKQPVWTWMNGDSTVNSTGRYGTIGVAGNKNAPPAREYGSMTRIENGKYLLFGGGGPSKNNSYALYNDLWIYEVVSNSWTWIGGGNHINTAANYGNKGVQTSSNRIGSRTGHNTWVTSSGEIYVFGGQTPFGKSNEMWKFSAPHDLISVEAVDKTTVCPGNALTIAYKIHLQGVNPFAANNAFIAELSNAAGEFTNPTVLGSIASTVSSSLVVYIPSNVAAASGYKIRVRSTSVGFTSQPFAKAITIDSPLVISSSVSTDICSGQRQNYPITSNKSAMSVSWSRAAVAGISNPAVSGQTTPVISEALINTTTAPVKVNYLITARSQDCAGAPFVYTVTVLPLPAKPSVTAMGSASFCKADSVFLHSSSETGNQWLVDGVAIEGAESQVLYAKKSGRYAVKVSNATGCVSVSEPLTVIEKPVIEKPVVTRIDSLLISSSSAGNQWFLNGSLISGAVDPTYKPTISGNYSVQVTQDGCISLQSSPVYIAVTAPGKELAVYPNPTLDGIASVYPSTDNAVLLEVFNSTGGKIWSGNEISGSYRIDLSRYNDGLYFIVATDQITGQITRRKIIKQ